MASKSYEKEQAALTFHQDNPGRAVSAVGRCGGGKARRGASCAAGSESVTRK